LTASIVDAAASLEARTALIFSRISLVLLTQQAYECHHSYHHEYHIVDMRIARFTEDSLLQGGVLTECGPLSSHAACGCARRHRQSPRWPPLLLQTSCEETLSFLFPPPTLTRTTAPDQTMPYRVQNVRNKSVYMGLVGEMSP
jgi:hypothetical protein